MDVDAPRVEPAGSIAIESSTILARLATALTLSSAEQERSRATPASSRGASRARKRIKLE